MITWEYAVLDLSFAGAKVLEDRLNSFGGEGWELVSLIRREAVFKCRKEEGR